MVFAAEREAGANVICEEYFILLMRAGANMRTMLWSWHCIVCFVGLFVYCCCFVFFWAGGGTNNHCDPVDLLVLGIEWQ